MVSFAWLDSIFYFDFWLIALGLVGFTYQFLITFSAEQGRRKDLIKRPAQNKANFNLGVLIPYSDSDQLSDLFNLIETLSQQEYPVSRLKIHIGCTEQTAGDLLDLGENELPQNIKIWTCPDDHLGNRLHPGQLQAWLIERCLATGGLGLGVFLKPTDLIRPDFCQNIAQASLTQNVIQGYVANRYQAESPLEQVIYTGQRLFNRIFNAGRYHMGLSCRLAESGWAAKQDVLEMVPYYQGQTTDNLEYTLRLNMAGIPIQWAPNVVVFNSNKPKLITAITEHLMRMMDHSRLLLRYGISLVYGSLFKGRPQLWDNLIQIIAPAQFLLATTFIAFGYFSEHPIPGTNLAIQGSAVSWYTVSALVLTSYVLQLAVARVKIQDVLANVIWTPLVYAFGSLILPLAFIQAFAFNVIDLIAGRNKQGYKSYGATRFNEAITAQPAILQGRHHKPEKAVRDMLLKNAMPVYETTNYQPQNRSDINANNTNFSAASLPPALDTGNDATNHYDWPVASEPTPAPTTISHNNHHLPSSVPRGSESPVSNLSTKPLPQRVEKAIAISNGQRQVDALITILTETDDAGEQSHQMTLNYKQFSVSSQRYSILDQAFYELTSKLMSRGMTIVSCGSCGYFYNPTADVPDSLKTVKNAGVCLFGKRGRNVNLTTDCVTVISQACTYHAPLEERETLVRQWRESLMSSNSTDSIQLLS